MVLRGGGEGSGYPGILEGSNREFEMTFRWNYLFSSVGTRHSSLGSRLSALGSRLSALSTRTMLLVMLCVQIFVPPSNCGVLLQRRLWLNPGSVYPIGGARSYNIFISCDAAARRRGGIRVSRHPGRQ